MSDAYQDMAIVPDSQDATISVNRVVEWVSKRVRTSALIETLVFLTAILVIDAVFGAGTRFFGQAFHPFWVILLLVTLQYGVPESLITAVLASAFLLVGNMPEQTFAENRYDYLVRVLELPFLWCATGLILGAMRTRQLNERSKLQEAVKKSRHAAAEITQAYQSVKQAKEELELRLASERCSLLTAFEVAKSLETVDPQQAHIAVEHLVRSALNPKKFSLYVWENNVLTLKSAYGWDKGDSFQTMFGAGSSLVQALVKNKRPFLSVVNEEDEKILLGQGMLAGPIIDQHTGRVYGVLKIEDIGFMGLGIRGHEIFRIACEWMALVQGNLEKHQDAQRTAEHNAGIFAPFGKNITMLAAKRQGGQALHG